MSEWKAIAETLAEESRSRVIPGDRRYLIAVDNGGHEFLLFDRKDALASGSWADVVEARDALERVERETGE